LNTEGASGWQIEEMIADKVQLFQSVVGRYLQRIDSVDLIVDHTQPADVAHIREHSRTNRSQIALVNAQQLQKQIQKKETIN